MMSSYVRVLSASLLALGLLTSCSQQPGAPAGAGSGEGASDRAGIRILVVVHDPPSNPFWGVVKRGVDQAAKDMGVKAEYRSGDMFDKSSVTSMARIIDEATDSKPTGLVVSIPDVEALGPSIQRAVKAGIPVISINSGSEAAEKLGVLTHVGQTEYEAASSAGTRMAASGVKKALCINHEEGNFSLDLRCKAFADAMAKGGASATTLSVDCYKDAADAERRIVAALQAAPDTDGLLSVGPPGALASLGALRSAGLLGKVKAATFDLSPEILEAVQKGDMLFAIDQQQYLQGYLPIVLLTLYKTNLNTMGTKIVMTGPSFVTKDDAARVIDLTKRGTR